MGVWTTRNNVTIPGSDSHLRRESMNYQNNVTTLASDVHLRTESVNYQEQRHSPWSADTWGVRVWTTSTTSQSLAVLATWGVRVWTTWKNVTISGNAGDPRGESVNYQNNVTILAVLATWGVKVWTTWKNVTIHGNAGDLRGESVARVWTCYTTEAGVSTVAQTKR